MKFKENWLFRMIEAICAFLAAICFFIPFYYISAVVGKIASESRWYSNVRMFSQVFGKDDTTSIEWFGWENKFLVFAFAFMFLLMLVDVVIALCVRNTRTRKFVGMILCGSAVLMLIIFTIAAMVGFSDNAKTVKDLTGGVGKIILRPHVGYIMFAIFSIGALVIHCVDHEFAPALKQASISQSGAAAPVAQAVQNAIGGTVHGLSGAYANSNIQIPAGQKLVIGSAPESCNVVINNSDYISRIHCSIRFDPDTQQYMVKDHSKNHTYLQNGIALQNGVYTYLPKGSIIYLATTDNMFQLM